MVASGASRLRTPHQVLQAACPIQRGSGLLRAASAGMTATIFVAEDDAQLREVVGAVLRSEGHVVVDLVDGGRLLVAIARSLREGAFVRADAIVADVHMPVMTGVALAEALRDVTTRIPTVLMTAFPDEQLRRRARMLGVCLLEKPFEAEALCAAVRNALASGAR